MKKTEKDVTVCLAIELKVLELYPGLFTEDEVYSPENQRGLPKESSEELLRYFRHYWDEFYESNPVTTREEIIKYAVRIDGTFGDKFDPPLF